VGQVQACQVGIPVRLEHFVAMRALPQRAGGRIGTHCQSKQLAVGGNSRRDPLLQLSGVRTNPLAHTEEIGVSECTPPRNTRVLTMKMIENDSVHGLRGAGMNTRSANQRLVNLRVLLLATATFNTSVASASPTQVAEASSNTSPEVWAVQASAGLDPDVIDALQRILSGDRRLLALRAYLRAGGTLGERWSWSQEQLSSYPATLEGKAATADIDAVVAAFEAANPGFTLRVTRKLRSLEVQIAHWNVDQSVGTAAAALVAALQQRFSGRASRPNTDQLRRALIEWNPNVAIALAAPGLSPHGQGRAFDFQVERGGKVIAGVDVTLASQQWDAARWTQKLRAAVSVAGDRFLGPLKSPYEPWHYAYAPRADTSDVSR